MKLCKIDCEQIEEREQLSQWTASQDYENIYVFVCQNKIVGYVYCYENSIINSILFENFAKLTAIQKGRDAKEDFIHFRCWQIKECDFSECIKQDKILLSNMFRMFADIFVDKEEDILIWLDKNELLFYPVDKQSNDSLGEYFAQHF